MNFVLVGRTLIDPEEAKRQVDRPNVQFASATSLEEVNSLLSTGDVDHLMMGAGLPLEVRLSIVESVFRRSSRTSVYLKDADSGKEGFLPFVRDVVHGLLAH